MITARVRLGGAFGIASAVSVGLFAAGVWIHHSHEFSYLIWNLFLAWVPVGFSLALLYVLQKHLWSSWSALALTALWVGFLPNSFYIISDLIHIQEFQRPDLLYDVVMLFSFVLNGVLLGCLSLYMVHDQLRRRMSAWGTAWLIGLVLLLCSFAIYIGRELRWNTWDVLLNPAGILVDISNRLLDVGGYAQVGKTTLSFFVLLSGMYVVVWCAGAVLRESAMRSSKKIVRTRI